MHEKLTPDVDEPDDAPLEQWKHDLRAEFEHWLESLDDIPDSDDLTIAEPEMPDLYSFYEQLAAATAESRKANRRTAEAFSQWSDTLSGLDGELRLVREQLARQPQATDDALPRAWCLALVEITDRMHRLSTAFSNPPRRAWLGNDSVWRATWENQRQGFAILISHVETLLTRAELTRILVMHQPFNPAQMSALAAEPNVAWPNNTVIEEIAPGYLLRGELLRVAQVKISTGNNP